MKIGVQEMTKTWRERLTSAMEAKGVSARELSLKAGKGPGYIHSIMKEGKEPTFESLLSICDALGVSIFQITEGIQMSKETVEIVKLLESNPDSRAAILQLLGSATKAH